jgi:hypothetical protein
MLWFYELFFKTTSKKNIIILARLDKNKNNLPFAVSSQLSFLLIEFYIQPSNPNRIYDPSCMRSFSFHSSNSRTFRT